MVDRRGSNQFSRRLALRASQFENAAENMIKEAATEALTILVLGSRVDTGKARSNWVVTDDAPNAGTIDPYYPYPKHSHADGQGSSEHPNAAGALAAGAQIVGEFRLGVDADLFITNNVKYLRYIPEGEVSALTKEAADAARVVIRSTKLL